MHRFFAWIRSHRRGTIVGAAGLLLLVVLVRRVVSRGDAPTAPQKRPVSVVVEAARSGDLPVYLDGIGTVTPLATVTVHSRVDGQLMALHFKEGQNVEAGDLLVEIDPRPFQVQLTQAEGQLARDQAQLTNAQTTLKRLNSLKDQKIVAQQEVDTQVSLVRQFEGALEVDRGMIDAAKLNLTYSRITAPISGRIGLRRVDLGNMVRASDTEGLAVITQIHPISVAFTIPEDSLPPLMAKLREGGILPVEAYDREGVRHLATGTLDAVDNAIDPQTGTVKLKAQFPNEGDTLFPNQFVNARLEVDVRRGATLVPERAVQHGTRDTFVYVVKDDHTVEVRPVRVALTEGAHAAVEEGVAPGELVVIDGAEGLRPGSPVTLKTHTPPNDTEQRQGG